jgi:hypothetical protein
MAKTSTDLANRALAKGFMVGLGQSPEAEDTQKVLDMYEAFKAFVEAANIYTIADDTDIDLAAYEWLAGLLWYFVATEFGKPAEDGLRLAAEYHLRRIQASQPTYERQTAEYF